eukprot:TRINITY_DN5931_c0_g1_i1.p1 TRINITY_DN5931_c0_g1~~TRINITY_DN5931_c0_g1_i1.p1  ORF type:complete len:695 (-),score=88.31 TRINITY_DN5931_c0_g1_i1:131-2215(-)
MQMQPVASGFLGRRQQPSRTSTSEWRRSKGWNSPSWWDLQLSTGLVAQTSAKGVLEFCDAHLSQLHLVNVATALHRIAKADDKLKVIGSGGMRSLVKRISLQLEDGSVEKSAVSLANIFWAFAKLGFMDVPLYDAIASEAIRHAGEFGCQECSNLCWALATLEFFHGPLWEAIRRRSIDLVSNFDIQDLSNTSWSYAKLGVRDDLFLSRLFEVATERLQEAIPQNISNLAWSCATLAMNPAPLLQGLATEATARYMEFEMQDLTNTVWAFAALEKVHDHLFEEVASQALQKNEQFLGRPSSYQSKSQLQEHAFALVSLAWVYAFTNNWKADLFTKLQFSLVQIGNELDLRSTAGVSPPSDACHTSSHCSNTQKPEPMMVVSTPGMAVVLKPPGWEVDGPRSEPENGAQALSDFLRANFLQSRFPLPYMPDFQYGFIHRLDVPSSGLILVGTTFAGLYSLRLQINTLTMNREYIVACHHLAPSELRRCQAAIDMVAKRNLNDRRSIGERSVSEFGKPALTKFTFVGHLAIPSSSFDSEPSSATAHGSRGTAEGNSGARSKSALSLVAIRIHTGRNHQIRTHLFHCGHPTAVDGKYTCQAVVLRSDSPQHDLQMARALACENGKPAKVDSLPAESNILLGQAVRRHEGMQQLSRSTSGFELRAFPGENTVEDGNGNRQRRPHIWSWRDDSSNSVRL